MAGHTLGPWRTQGWVPTWAYIQVKDAAHNTVCSLYPDRLYSRDYVEANARLISAAPDLLAALKAILHWRVPHDDVLTVTDGSREAIARARDVVAKATGEA